MQVQHGGGKKQSAVLPSTSYSCRPHEGFKREGMQDCPIICVDRPMTPSIGPCAPLGCNSLTRLKPQNCYSGTSGQNP